MQDKLDQIALSDVIEIYKEISSMVKALEEKEKQAMESEKNGWWD